MLQFSLWITSTSGLMLILSIIPPVDAWKTSPRPLTRICSNIFDQVKILLLTLGILDPSEAIFSIAKSTYVGLPDDSDRRYEQACSPEPYARELSEGPGTSPGTSQNVLARHPSLRAAYEPAPSGRRCEPLESMALRTAGHPERRCTVNLL